MFPTARRPRFAASRKTPHGYRVGLASDTARFVAFCALVAVVFAMGGGSRADILSLPLLRPLAIGFAAYALAVARPGELRAVSWPLGLLTCLLALVALQLVPLPPNVWTILPGRALYVQIARDAGIPLGYRPLSLAPSRTVNTLFSLSIPFAAVLVATIQGKKYRARLLTVLLVACGASALVAIAQIAGSDHGPLYLYRITNNGFPVGLFANRNHQALLMAVLLVLLGEHYRRLRRAGSLSLVRTGAISLCALVVFALVLVAGSRAGLILAIGVVPAIAWMNWADQNPADKSGGRFNWRYAAIVVGSFVALVALAIAFSRAASLQRLWSDDALQDTRVSSLPILGHMLRDHWLFGIGFGAFQGVFLRYETLDVLSPFIFNAAHDDWIQFPLEGGVVASALLLVTLVWLAARTIRLLRSMRSDFDGARFVSVVVLVLVALASFVDYPLRTPIFMLVGAVAVAELSRSSDPVRRTEG